MHHPESNMPFINWWPRDRRGGDEFLFSRGCAHCRFCIIISIVIVIIIIVAIVPPPPSEYACYYFIISPM